MTYTVSFADLQAQDVAVVHGHVDVGHLPEFLGGAYEEVAGTVAAQGLSIAGAPFGRYRPDETGFEVAAGFPVSAAVRPEGRVVPDRLPEGRVAHTLHVGSYDAVAAAYEAAEKYVVDNGFEPAGPPWELYLDEPDVAEPRTEVFLPCREAVAQD